MKFSLSTIRTVAQFATTFNLNNSVNEEEIRILQQQNKEEIEISKLISDELDKNKKLTNFLEMSSIKFNRLDEKTKQNFKFEVATFISSLKKIITVRYPNKINLLKNFLTEENIRKAYRLKHKAEIKIKKEIDIKVKESKAEDKKYFEQVRTEAGKVNFIKDEVNSKFVEQELKRINVIFKLIKDDIIPLQQKVKNLAISSTTLYGVAAGLGLAAAGLWFSSIWVPALAPVATLTSIAAGTVGIVAGILKDISNIQQEKLGKLFKQINKVDTSDINKIDYLELFNSIRGTISFIGSLSSIVKDGYKEFLKKTKSLGASIVNGIDSLVGAGFDIDSTIQGIQKINKVHKELAESHGRLNSLGISYQKWNQVDWVVLDETGLDKPYNEGGVGGKNLVFKNRITNKIYKLDELLQKTKTELRLMRLAKVYNPRTKEWYIRTWKNKDKHDNLG
ncbi:Uncharacterised protein [Metamycoplasma arthritidis]|uniref:Uncharacterized protein n=1 Tax=Metamycoplasma arthritidis (strain 158L3-1) TaxID=243272 RepID=B3PLX0_META1|nr:hypothetical protein [Metamycoplasma arthritidis]ACF07022.1 hypothetical protein MARTH_orf066 [Metamycoplasma arthritidis 158L3-1]VEU78550.1 Uncharacterised protein [Metamycoplasma arthritidis]